MKWNWIILKIILVKSSELKVDIILCYSVMLKTSISSSVYKYDILSKKFYFLFKRISMMYVLSDGD